MSVEEKTMRRGITIMNFEAHLRIIYYSSGVDFYQRTLPLNLLLEQFGDAES